MPVFVRGGQYRQGRMNGVRRRQPTAFKNQADNSVVASIMFERRSNLMLFTGKFRGRP